MSEQLVQVFHCGLNCSTRVSAELAAACSDEKCTTEVTVFLVLLAMLAWMPDGCVGACGG
jgi:hypothetical protein